MPKYRKKPVVIEAVQLTPETVIECYEFLGIEGVGNFPETGFGIDPADGQFKLTTLEGVMEVPLNNFIIKGIRGEFYSCDPEIFEATYDKIEG